MSDFWSNQFLVARFEAHRANVNLLERFKISGKLAEPDVRIRACKTQLNLLRQISVQNLADMNCYRQISAELAALEVSV